ncbi:DUF1517 domain-containing protein [Dolichospermum compactum]|uniref:DUF1517 domain-containing protein n=1 Tax=Dolichospermum compactum NIES-806 TaxID=1973481 RepID=A0A1Z4V3T6_9CYAN|nr:DUF1517 domain-containing protein [Dolichospermum compactum]BAZ86182.1 hypothetical protein NIES806_23930 [Dolichospermum compactum NIES-806]
MFNRMMGRTRYIVCRLFLHLKGDEVAPILGVLNSAARTAINADGDMDILGEELVQLCQTFLQYDEYWFSAANEGDVFWNEGETGDYVNELFTDSAQRYGANLDLNSSNQPLSLPATRNIIVMITVAAEGEIPELETDLANISALKAAFKALINLHYKHKLRAIQVHFSPAQLGDELSSDQLLEYYPELIPL